MVGTSGCTKQLPVLVHEGVKVKGEGGVEGGVLRKREVYMGHTLI